LWEVTGEKSNLLKAAWPKYDPALAAEDEIEIPVQVTGSCAAWWWCRRVPLTIKSSKPRSPTKK